ncbi:MAG TPA: thermonuclease family protein [Candidatus Saccharimonadales bacterium]|nr:thermonuclease family protein [Candidatus Saccharimonadales bacterium]
MRIRSRPNKRLVAILAAVIAVSGTVSMQTGWLSRAGSVLERSQPGLYSVERFIDGDTIAVDMNGHVESVRFIGIDTPETHKPDTPVQCWGPEASAYTQALIGRSKVRLASDALSTNRDRYGRLLRYVYLPDGTLVNRELVLDGQAFYYPYFPFGKSAVFGAAQEAAMAARKGIWSACEPERTSGGGWVSSPRDS